MKGININLDGSRITFRDLDLIHDSGMSLVIFSLKPSRYAKSRNVNIRTAFSEVLDEAGRLATYAKSSGIASIIEYSEFPLFENKVSMRSSEFWHDSKYINEIYSVAGTLAKRFANNDAIIGYKVMDEPVVKKRGRLATPDNWRDIQRGIILAIRKVDSSKYVVVTSGPGGTGRDYLEWEPIADPKVIYGVHFFAPHCYTHQGIDRNKCQGEMKYPSAKVNQSYLREALMPIIRFREKYNVPVLIGSFGVAAGVPGELEYLSDLFDLFEKNRFSWAFWQYNGYPKWNLGREVDGKAGDINLGRESKRWRLLEEKILRVGSDGQKYRQPLPTNIAINKEMQHDP